MRVKDKISVLMPLFFLEVFTTKDELVLQSSFIVVRSGGLGRDVRRSQQYTLVLG